MNSSRCVIRLYFAAGVVPNARILFVYILQTFRILDGKDGKVDGVISIAKRDGSGLPAAVPRTEVQEQAKQALV